MNNVENIKKGKNSDYNYINYKKFKRQINRKSIKKDTTLIQTKEGGILINMAINMDVHVQFYYAMIYFTNI
jgi:hypothetical protein